MEMCGLKHIFAGNKASPCQESYENSALTEAERASLSASGYLAVIEACFSQFSFTVLREALANIRVGSHPDHLARCIS
jgi:hypothetical protein